VEEAEEAEEVEEIEEVEEVEEAEEIEEDGNAGAPVFPWLPKACFTRCDLEKSGRSRGSRGNRGSGGNRGKGGEVAFSLSHSLTLLAIFADQ
jgi:hypothetical protein